MHRPSEVRIHLFKLLIYEAYVVNSWNLTLPPLGYYPCTTTGAPLQLMSKYRARGDSAATGVPLCEHVSYWATENLRGRRSSEAGTDLSPFSPLFSSHSLTECWPVQWRLFPGFPAPSWCAWACVPVARSWLAGSSTIWDCLGPRQALASDSKCHSGLWQSEDWTEMTSRDRNEYRFMENLLEKKPLL